MLVLSKPIYSTRHKRSTEFSQCGKSNYVIKANQNFHGISSFSNGNFTLEKWPWMAGLYCEVKRKLKYLCGGSICKFFDPKGLKCHSKIPFLRFAIRLNGKTVLLKPKNYSHDISVTTNVILTAAHCVKNKTETNIKYPHRCKIVVGTSYLKSELDNLKYLHIERFITHDSWNMNTKDYDADIALVILKGAIEFDYNAQPICLPPKMYDHSDLIASTGVVAGWDLVHEEKSSSELPEIVEMAILSEKKCMAADEHYANVSSPRTFCSAPNFGGGPCQGDKFIGFKVV